MNSQPASNVKRKGINIEAAMEILSQRRPHHHDHENDHSNEVQHHVDPSLQNHSCSETGINRKIHEGLCGQVIDLCSTASEASTPTSTVINQNAYSSASEPAAKSNLLKEEISEMTGRQRIQAVLKAQEDRVLTYRRFDEGLTQVMNTANMTYYPALCAHVTATFSVLSDTIIAIRDEAKTSASLRELLKQLQKHERDKLNFTAALHLEQIREVAAYNEDQENANGVQTSQDMLKSSISTLQQNIRVCEEEINLVLDEIRCLLLEEKDDS